MTNLFFHVYCGTQFKGIVMAPSAEEALKNARQSLSQRSPADLSDLRVEESKAKTFIWPEASS